MVRLFPNIVLPGASEEVVLVLVPAAEWNASMTPALGATLSSCEWVERCGIDRYESFVLLTYEHVRTEQGAFQQLTFGRDYSTINPATGVPWGLKPVKTEWTSRDYPWPAELLENPVFIPDFGNMIATVSVNPLTGVTGRVFQPRLYPLYSFRKEGSFLSKVRRRYYLSNTPFAEAKFDLVQPEATPVRWDWGPQGSGELLCLHDDVVIPAKSMVYASVYGGTVGSQGSGEVPAQTFARTNFKRRAPFIIANDAEPDSSGLHVRIVDLIYPPVGSKIERITPPGFN